ncbi:nuclear transport factor 2 family protein [uncultured Flavobacterium sp.]|uniref:nuclear transport factor 2 family protein n=1 Tax=uncultured Flavobacterium sp. TaxID=165435 RepID=UPI0030EECF10|tara:strand:- start:102555 stop:102917 length:363 start_codon:yes stop_codon:yes gene_type:complete
MTNVQIIKDFYASDNYRDVSYVDNLMDDLIELEWNSSVGQFTYDKADVMKLSKELFENYTDSKVEVLNIFGEGDSVAVRYNYYASTIESSSEMVLITKIIVIWEFKDGKIIKGHQMSVLG